MLYMLTTVCQWRLFAQRISGVFDGPAVFLSTSRRRVVADDQSFLGDASAQGDRPASKPQRGIIAATRSSLPRPPTRVGYDAGKKFKRRKRHELTDTNGLPVAGVVHEGRHPGSQWRTARFGRHPVSLSVPATCLLPTGLTVRPSSNSSRPPRRRQRR